MLAFRSVRHHDVVIVGAGLAGLAAARRLREKGHEPLVLEATDSAGGRVQTDRVDGYLLDRGFQVFLTAYPEAQRIFDYERLDLREFEPGALVHFGGSFHRVSDPLRNPGDLFASLRAPIGSIRDKLAVLRFRKRVTADGLEAVFSRAETSACRPRSMT